MHPRLLSTLILIEPVILDGSDDGPNPALLSTIRRDIWKTRAEAETALRKAFAAWDRRALESFFKYGLRAVPTTIYDTSLRNGVGGNGGVAAAKVEKEVLQGCGHLFVFEKPDEAASVTAR